MPNAVGPLGMLRRAVLPLILLALLVIVVVLAHHAPPTASDLQLLVRGADGRFAGAVQPPAPAAQATRGAAPRIPLVLAVRNDAGRALRPARLDVLVPLRYRLRTAAADTVVSRFAVPGEPVARYRVALRGFDIGPGQTLPVPGADTLWLQPATPRLRCVLAADSVPSFEPTPPVTAAELTPVRLFYAFRGGNLGQRSAGLLTLRVDSALVAPPPPERVRRYPVHIHWPAIPWPKLDSLRLVGVRRTYCGPVADPYPMVATLWRVARGGHVFGLSIDGKVRKYVYDLNGDSIADLVLWDPDGDGRFEAENQVRYVLPAFLFPHVAAAAPARPAAPSSVAAPKSPAAPASGRRPAVDSTAPADTGAGGAGRSGAGHGGR